MRACRHQVLVTGAAHTVAMSASLTIDCDECVMQGTDVCDDCVVTFLCERDPEAAVIIDADEARTVRLLSGAGLVPRLRHQRRTG